MAELSDKTFVTKLTIDEAMCCQQAVASITIKGKDAIVVGNLMKKLNNFIERNMTVSQGGQGEVLEQFKPPPGSNNVHSHQVV